MGRYCLTSGRKSSRSRPSAARRRDGTSPRSAGRASTSPSNNRGKKSVADRPARRAAPGHRLVGGRSLHDAPRDDQHPGRASPPRADGRGAGRRRVPARLRADHGRDPQDIDGHVDLTAWRAATRMASVRLVGSRASGRAPESARPVATNSRAGSRYFFGATITTVQGAWVLTWRAVSPSAMSSRPRLLWLPITSRSASISAATSTMT